MNRRKGERPVVPPVDRYAPGHPVAHAIATGDTWFDAWQRQRATPIDRLARTTGIPAARLLALSAGDPPSAAELDALADAWTIDAADLRRSIADQR